MNETSHWSVHRLIRTEGIRSYKTIIEGIGRKKKEERRKTETILYTKTKFSFTKSTNSKLKMIQK